MKGESVTWEITLVDEQGFIGISHLPSQNPEWPEYLVSTNITAANWTWEDVRGSMMLTYGNGFIRLQDESLDGEVIIELADYSTVIGRGSRLYLVQSLILCEI